MPQMTQVVAISQAIRCAPKSQIPAKAIHKTHGLAMGGGKGGAVAAKKEALSAKINRQHIWNDCDTQKKKVRNSSCIGTTAC